MDGTPRLTREQLGTLVKAHQAELYRYLRYLGASSVTAEDLVQEAFLAALESPNPVGPGEPAASAWLRGIARNRFFLWCRRQRTSPVSPDSRLLAQAEAVWVGEFLRDGDGFGYVEALRRCTESLSDEQRRAIDLRYAKRAPRAEMARRLDMTENGVKSLLRRIRARLGECIERRLRSQEV